MKRRRIISQFLLSINLVINGSSDNLRQSQVDKLLIAFNDFIVTIVSCIQVKDFKLIHHDEGKNCFNAKFVQGKDKGCKKSKILELTISTSDTDSYLHEVLTEQKPLFTGCIINGLQFDSFYMALNYINVLLDEYREC